MTQEAVTYSVDSRGVATVLFDAPDRPVNVITFDIGRRFAEIFAELGKRDDLILVIVRSGKARNFIAGADITEIESIKTPEEGMKKSLEAQRIPDLIESLQAPSLAVINGACLGGGLELALGCTYRIATAAPQVKIGLPEVQLGFIPGMGGTWRLPRLIGLTGGLDMILTGKQVDADKARRIGLVDGVIPLELVDQELERIVRTIQEEGGWTTRRTQNGLSVLSRNRRPTRKSLATSLLEKTSLGRALVFRQARKGVLKQTGGHYPAPLKAIEVIRASLHQPDEEALKKEAEGFGALAATTVSKNLVRLFFMREKALKGKGGRPVGRIERIGVLGAGTMGAGIAQLAAWNEIPVRLKDINADFVAGGLATAYRLSGEAVKRRKVSVREMEQKMHLISGTVDYSGFRRLDLVIEAVIEDLSIKKRTYQELEGILSENAIIATNTSSLPMDVLAADLKRPDRFVAMHFFNPVHRMPLLEISSAAQTSASVLEASVDFARRLGKIPLVVKPCPGFLVNRLLMPYLNEAGLLLDEGAKAESIDEAMLSFGMPMGPLRLMDEIGIDVGFKVAAILGKAYGDRMKPSMSFEQLYQNGFLGKKKGLGFYRYEKGRSVSKEIDPKVAALIAQLREQLGPSRGKGAAHFMVAQLSERMVMAMINEAARALSESIVAKADDIDLGMIMGTGFPPFLGGPMRYADTLGLDRVAETLQRLSEEAGDRFKPADLLLQLAKEKKSFADYSPAPSVGVRTPSREGLRV